MANSILLSHEYMEQSSVVVSGATVASASTPHANVLTPQPSELCRFQNNTAYFVFQGVGTGGVAMPPVLSEPELPVAIFVGYTNCDNSNSIRIRCAVDEASLTSSPDYDSGEIAFISDPGRTIGYYRRTFPRGRHHLTYLPPNGYDTSFGTWWRIDILGGAEEGYIEAGIVSIGRPFQAAFPVENGWSFGSQPLWVGQTAMGGQRYRRSVVATNTLEATIQTTDEMEALELHDFIRRRGDAKPSLFVIDPTAYANLQNHMAWGHVTATTPVRVPYYGLWQMSLRAEETP